MTVPIAPGQESTPMMRSALRSRDFRRLLLALGVSQAGDWLYNVALLALVWQRTGSSAWLGATTAARVLPIVVLGPLSGVVADRWDRRFVMITSDLLRAVLMVVLAAVAALGLPILLAPVLAAAATAAAAPYPACAAAATPRLVEAHDLAAANAARSVLGPLCIVAGPALGALLLLLGSPAAAFLGNAVTFLVSAAAVAAIPRGPAFRRVHPVARPGHASVLDDMRTGGAALRTRPAAARLVAADVLCSVVYGVLTVLLVLVSARLHLDGHGYGYLLAAFGAGGVLGALIAGRLARNACSPTITAAALTAVGLPLPLLALTPGLGYALAWAAVGGAGAVVIEVLTETTLQRSLPEDIFALAYGFAFPASLGGIVAGSLIAAPLEAALGLAGALGVVGAVVLGYAAFLLRRATRSPAEAVCAT